jgi:hypothetical protein
MPSRGSDLPRKSRDAPIEVSLSSQSERALRALTQVEGATSPASVVMGFKEGRAPVRPPNGMHLVLRAWWGDAAPAAAWDALRGRNATSTVAALLALGPPYGPATNRVLRGDPLPGVRKVLLVEFAAAPASIPARAHSGGASLPAPPLAADAAALAVGTATSTVHVASADAAAPAPVPAAVEGPQSRSHSSRTTAAATFAALDAAGPSGVLRFAARAQLGPFGQPLVDLGVDCVSDLLDPEVNSLCWSVWVSALEYSTSSARWWWTALALPSFDSRDPPSEAPNRAFAFSLRPYEKNLRL